MKKCKKLFQNHLGMIMSEVCNLDIFPRFQKLKDVEIFQPPLWALGVGTVSSLPENTAALLGKGWEFC